MTTKKIYLSPPHLDGRERDLLLEAFDSNWITTLGPQVDAFEREICQKTGNKYAAALSSGTAALHLALLLLGVGPGDEVLCSDLTFVASVNPIFYLGASPRFVDSDKKTWNLNPDLLEEEFLESEKKGRMPKAAVVVDLYGQCANFSRIEDLCQRYNVPIVEDAAEALGATYRGRQAGQFGILGVYSFNGNKIITTSGGGMLVSDNENLVAQAKFLSTQARDHAPHYEHSRIGYNYRMSNLLAALGRGQLERLNEKIRIRKVINARYREAFDGIPGIELMPEAEEGVSNAWLTVILITPSLFGADREAIRLALEREDIESRPIWKPMHLQTIFKDCPVRGGAVGEDLFARGLCLPSGTQMSDGDMGRIIETVLKCGVR